MGKQLLHLGALRIRYFRIHGHEQLIDVDVLERGKEGLAGLFRRREIDAEGLIAVEITSVLQTETECGIELVSAGFQSDGNIVLIQLLALDGDPLPVHDDRLVDPGDLRLTASLRQEAGEIAHSDYTHKVPGTDGGYVGIQPLQRIRGLRRQSLQLQTGSEIVGSVALIGEIIGIYVRVGLAGNRHIDAHFDDEFAALKPA